MFKKAKVKGSIHCAGVKCAAKIKVKQKKTLKVAGKVQKKQYEVTTPKQKMTQVKKSYAQKFETNVPTPKQKKYNDASISARLKALIG